MHVFSNFKGFLDANLDLFKPLTIIIGPNGSGKTNVIEGVELLSFLVHGRPLHEISDIGKGERKGLEIRGGLQACPYRDSDSFSFTFLANIQFLGRNRPFIYSLEVRVRPKPRISFEQLVFTDDNTLIFQTESGTKSTTSGDVRVEYNNFARGGRKPKALVSANVSVISQYKDFAHGNTKYDQCAGLVNGIMRYLRSSFVFDPNPKLMHGYERIGDDTLSRDGSNLSAVLYSLYNGNKEQQKSLGRLLKWISQLPEEPYVSWEFVDTKLGDVIFALRESSGLLADARLLSDGTLRCLAVMTALETVAENSRVVIEEFDNGLHPSRVEVMIKAIDSCCKRRKLNVLVTTHNPATLNALQPDQLLGVVFCAWDNKSQAFKLINIHELPRYDEFLERGRLGDLVTRRIVEKYLAPDFEEKQKEKALEWLRNQQ